MRSMNFFTFIFCIAAPLYLALRGSVSFSDIAFLLSSLSERVGALHVTFASTLATSPGSIFREAFDLSTEPAKSVQTSQGRNKTKRPSLPSGLAHCINSLEQYPLLAEHVLQRKHARYAKQTPAQKAISNKLGYPAHFEKAREGIEVNARFSEQIARIARKSYHVGSRALENGEDAEFGIVDLAFGHLSRDWSTQGAKERQAVFPPILNRLEQHFRGNVRGQKVLVPGSGMGRLASDIADLGAFVLLL